MATEEERTLARELGQMSQKGELVLELQKLALDKVLSGPAEEVAQSATSCVKDSCNKRQL